MNTNSQSFWMMLAMAVTLLWSAAASAQDTWAMLPINTRSVDQDAADTFRELLRDELSTRTGSSFKMVDTACQDLPCAIEAGQQNQADVVVFGSLSALGRKLIVAVTVVDVQGKKAASTQKIAIDRLEDLDQASTRVATAITQGSTTDETAELGTVVQEEVAPDRRREGQRGWGLRVGGLAPLGDGYGGSSPGVVMDLSYWFETRNFAIEPRLGLRFTADDNSNNFFEMPMDVGAYYILGKGDFAPFFGGGGGLRWLAESREETVQTGDVIITESVQQMNDSAFGFGVFARAGVLLFRTYTLRVALTADYNITFVELNDRSTPQSFTAGIGVYF